MESAGTAREQEQEMGLKNNRLTEGPHMGHTYLSLPFSGQLQLEEKYIERDQRIASILVARSDGVETATFHYKLFFII